MTRVLSALTFTFTDTPWRTRGLWVAGITLLLIPRPALNAQEIRIDNDDLAGLVTSSQGPEAGVWVIAETTDLPTRFIKIVVTDEQGRYLIPDLPPAQYRVWVRGYGLVDSPQVRTQPSKILNLEAVLAPSAAAAAEYYPPLYWLSMLSLHTVDQWRRGRQRRGGLAEPEDVRRDRRRAEVAGLDRAHSRHQRQRQAGRLCGARPATRFHKG